MKKTGIIFAILMLVACATKPEEQKFVNPIFYKVMTPVSNGTWYTQITPNEMIASNEGTILKQKCSLIENTIDAVTLLCEGAYKPEDILQYRFVLSYEEKDDKIVLVYMRYRSPNELEKFTSQETLLIPYNN